MIYKVRARVKYMGSYFFSRVDVIYYNRRELYIKRKVVFIMNKTIFNVLMVIFVIGAIAPFFALKS